MSWARVFLIERDLLIGYLDLSDVWLVIFEPGFVADDMAAPRCRGSNRLLMRRGQLPRRLPTRRLRPSRAWRKSPVGPFGCRSLVRFLP
jgi:hypothetical protein